jgi:RNA polymerase sigma-70 factor (ECF subfamily)
VRDLAETDDLVQVALLRSLDHVEEFEARREGAFLAYLRSILLNLVRDEIRGHRRRPGRESLDEESERGGRSFVEETVGVETFAAYEQALATLPEEHQEAVILRVEFGYTYEELAAALGSPSADAARMSVTRAWSSSRPR